MGIRLSMPTERRIQGNDSGMSPCYELPNHSTGSPTELATFEQGTYEEVQKELVATARVMAIQLRRKRTLQQLEQLQFDDPEIIRVRRFPSHYIAELDCEPPKPAELPGLDVEASSTNPASGVCGLGTLVDGHDPKEGYLPTWETELPGHFRTEPPFSDLEAVGNSNSRGQIDKFPTVSSNPNISYITKDMQPQNISRLPSETEAAIGNYNCHPTENTGDSSGNNELRSNYTGTHPDRSYYYQCIMAVMKVIASSQTSIL
ncbi:MAG: hypothetical protein Q9221_000866 [Calogaya cf. arnoldii]